MEVEFEEPNGIPATEQIWTYDVTSIAGADINENMEGAEWYAYFDNEIWLAYITKSTLAEDTSRSLEQEGYCVILEKRTYPDFSEPDDVIIYRFSHLKHHALNHLEELLWVHITKEELEQCMEKHKTHYQPGNSPDKEGERGEY